MVRKVNNNKDSIELNSIVNSQFSEISRLLSKYKDVFPNELPKGLPPKRNVDHKIEVIPSETPPTRPYFRMSPKE